jgi:nucleoside-diphosphate-sugar epimerase
MIPKVFTNGSIYRIIRVNQWCVLGSDGGEGLNAMLQWGKLHKRALGLVIAGLLVVFAQTMPSVAPASEFAGLTLDLNDSLKLNFLFKDPSVTQADLTRLVDYFLTALTVPNNDLWVNLSPYERNRILDQTLIGTRLGELFVLMDRQLKQAMTAALHPDHPQGQLFWQDYMAHVMAVAGLDSEAEMSNKVWIVPGRIELLEHGTTVELVEHQLRVLLDVDYVTHQGRHEHESDRLQRILPQDIPLADARLALMRKWIIPVVTAKVNGQDDFMALRDAFSAIILATWYKRSVSDSFLHDTFVNKKKMTYLSVFPKERISALYEAYVDDFFNGVFTTVREQYDPSTQSFTNQSYMSGGIQYVESSTVIKKEESPAYLGYTHIPVQLRPQFTVLKPVALTGATGFVGGRLFELWQKEKVIRTLVRGSSLERFRERYPHEDNVILGDVMRIDDWRDLLRDQQALIHTAGNPDATVRKDDEVAVINMMKSNVIGPVMGALVAHDENPDMNKIFLSSIIAGNIPKDVVEWTQTQAEALLPIIKNFYQNPNDQYAIAQLGQQVDTFYNDYIALDVAIGPYPILKRLLEDLLFELAKEEAGVKNIVIVRPSTVIGPGMMRRSRAFIRVMMDAALDPQQRPSPVTVFKNFGTTMIHVDDLAQILAALAHVDLSKSSIADTSDPLIIELGSKVHQWSDILEIIYHSAESRGLDMDVVRHNLRLINPPTGKTSLHYQPNLDPLKKLFNVNNFEFIDVELGINQAFDEALPEKTETLDPVGGLDFSDHVFKLNPSHHAWIINDQNRYPVSQQFLMEGFSPLWDIPSSIEPR